MIRAVLDTNLLISYLLTHRPPIATLIDHHLAGDDFALVTASELLVELDDLLALVQVGGIPIVTAAKFLGMLEQESGLTVRPLRDSLDTGIRFSHWFRVAQ